MCGECCRTAHVYVGERPYNDRYRYVTWTPHAVMHRARELRGNPCPVVPKCPSYMNGLVCDLNGLFFDLNGLFFDLNGLFCDLNGLFCDLNGLFCECQFNSSLSTE